MTLTAVSLRCVAFVLALGALAGIARSGGFERDALKQVVSACAFTTRAVGVSFPCLYVQPGKSEADGYAVIRGPLLKTEVLVVPVEPIVGIEDPALLTAPFSHLWEAAWAARHFVADALGRRLPRGAIGLAVNSVGSRSQDQFHIHVDCVDATVRRAILAGKDDTGRQWRRFSLPLGGKPFWARSVASADLKGVNVAQLLSTGLPGARMSMERMNVAVFGITMKDGKEGFLLLATDSDLAAEALLDHSCWAS